MGWNSTVVVHIDALHVIKEDPVFGKNLAVAIEHLDIAQRLKPGDVIDVPSQNHVNAAEVVEKHHADMINLIAVGANTGWDLGCGVFWSESHKSPEEFRLSLLKALAEKLGYEVHKKRKRGL